MKIKSNKGVTLGILIITIVILVIITAITIRAGFNLAETGEFENLKTDLLLIQSKCKIKAEQKAIGDIKEEDLYGTKQTGSEYDGWYLLSQQDLSNMGVENISAEDQYYVDYENDDVAYGKGFEYDGKTYYKLSEILED